MMRLALCVLLALWMLAGAQTPARAEPISISILTALSIEATATAVAVTTVALTAVASTALSIGVSYLKAAMAGQQAPDTPVGGSSGKLAAGGVVPRAFGVGTYMTGGSLTYHNTFGQDGKTPNAYYVQEIALADLPSNGLVQIIVNGTPVTFDPNAAQDADGVPIPEYTFAGQTFLWARFFDGTQTEADARMLALFEADADRPYSNRRVGFGVAKVVMTARVRPEVFQGFPQYKFALRGISLYDRRHDSTNGGSGAQRLNDPDTWAFTENVAVIRENILRGIRYDGVWQWGAQTVTAAQLPAGSWVAAANECDAPIALAGGGTEPQFRAGGEILYGQLPAEVLTELLKADNGKLAEIGGVYKTRSGAAGAAVFSITDADIRTKDAQTCDPFVGQDATINYVTARYLSPAEGWALKDAPPLADDALEALDGRRLPTSVDYGFVSWPNQVQRLMRSERDTSRAWRRHVLPLPPDAFVLEPLDVISWTSARNGYVNKTFDITTADDLPSLNMGVGIKELDGNAYNWSPANQKPIVDGGLAIVRPAPQTIVDWFVEPYIFNIGGVERAGVRFGWDNEQDDVDGIRVQVRLKASGVLQLDTEEGKRVFEAAALAVSQNLVPNTQYQGQIQYRPASPREAAWSGWRDVTTPDVRISGSELADEINAKLALVEPTLEQANIIVKALQPLAPLRNDPIVAGVIPPVLFERIESVGQAALTSLRRLTELEHKLVEAGFGTHTANGRYTIEGIESLRKGNSDFQSQVSVILDVVNANIALKASTTQLNDVAQAIIQGFVPAYRWEFNGTVEGWAGVGATATAGAATIDVVSTSAAPAIQSPVIALDADSNRIVKVQVRRRAGTNWGVQLQWGAAYASSKTFAVPTAPDSWNEVALDMRDEPAWTGTLTSLRIGLGLAVSDEFEIDYVELGNSRLQDLLLPQVEARVAAAEIAIDGMQGAIDAKASVTTVSNLTARVSAAELSIDAANSAINLRATLDDLDAVSDRVTNAEVTINAALGNIHLLVESSGVSQAEAAGSAELMALRQRWLDDAKSIRLISRAQTELQSGIDQAGAFFAKVRESLEAQVADAKSTLQQTFQTLASQLAAEAAARLDLTAQFNANLVSFTDEVRIRAEETAASLSRHTALAGVVGDASAGLVHDTQVLVGLVGDNSSGIIHTLNGVVSTVGDAGSGIVHDLNDLIGTVGNGTVGLVHDVNSLNVTVGNSSAGLVHDTAALVVTVGNNSAGLVHDVNSLSVAVGNNSAGIVHDLAAVVSVVGNSSSGLVHDINSLFVTVGDNSAGIVHDLGAVISVVGNSSSGLVHDLNSLSSTVGGHTTSLSNLMEVDGGGQSVRWSLLGNIDGALGGLVLTGVKGNATGATFNLFMHGDVMLDGTLTAAKADIADFRAAIVTAHSIGADQLDVTSARAALLTAGVAIIDTLQLVNGSVSAFAGATQGPAGPIAGAFNVASDTKTITVQSGRGIRLKANGVVVVKAETFAQSITMQLVADGNVVDSFTDGFAAGEVKRYVLQGSANTAGTGSAHGYEVHIRVTPGSLASTIIAATDLDIRLA